MKNTGVIFANDANKERSKGLIGNIHRLGARNIVVCNHDGRDFPRVMGGFDRVLLDAPCSGTGVIAKDASVKTNKDEKDFMQSYLTCRNNCCLPLLIRQTTQAKHVVRLSPQRQPSNRKKLTQILGYIVYSTCSVTVEENEQVIGYALSRCPNVRLVDTGLTFGEEGFTSFRGKTFDPTLRLTRRYYPHNCNVDGFYVAKLKKIAPSPGHIPSDNTKKASTPSSVVGDFSHDPHSLDGFGSFDEAEDREWMRRAKERVMRKRGGDVRVLRQRTAQDA